MITHNLCFCGEIIIIWSYVLSEVNYTRNNMEVRKPRNKDLKTQKQWLENRKPKNND